VLVTDAMTDLDPEMHNHAVEKVFPRIGERVTTAEILEIL
jgi:isochorismate hydrolase